VRAVAKRSLTNAVSSTTRTVLVAGTLVEAAVTAVVSDGAGGAVRLDCRSLQVLVIIRVIVAREHGVQCRRPA
jgi:hypothetical protein